MVAAVGLLVVAITTAALLWTNRRQSGDLTATGASSPLPTSVATAAAPTQAAGAGSEQGGAGTDAPASGPAVAVSTAPTTPTASTEASTDVVGALDDLLDASAQARGNVAATAQAVQSCQGSATQAATTFRRARDNRNRLASEATALAGTPAPGVAGLGDAVRAFIALQQSSAQADGAFADWADEIAAGGCRSQARHTTDWDLANRYSADATAAKARFVRLWNPIAAPRGLRARSADAI